MHRYKPGNSSDRCPIGHSGGDASSPGGGGGGDGGGGGGSPAAAVGKSGGDCSLGSTVSSVSVAAAACCGAPSSASSSSVCAAPMSGERASGSAGELPDCGELPSTIGPAAVLGSCRLVVVGSAAPSGFVSGLAGAAAATGGTRLRAYSPRVGICARPIEPFDTSGIASGLPAAMPGGAGAGAAAAGSCGGTPCSDSRGPGCSFMLASAGCAIRGGLGTEAASRADAVAC